MAYDPAQDLDPFAQFITGLGGGLQTNLDDWKTLLALRRPSMDEATERARLLRPLLNTPMGQAGYGVGAYFPLPPLREVLPGYFREGQDADALARSQKIQADMRSRFMRPYQMQSPPDLESLRSMIGQPGFGGLLGLSE